MAAPPSRRLGVAATGEPGEIAGRHDHRVEAGALELGDVLGGCAESVGDRELPGRDVRKELEDAVEVSARGQEKDLRVDLLERLLEILFAASFHHAVEPELERAAVQELEPA